MSVLSEKTVRGLVERKELVVKPEAKISSNAVDISLSDHLTIYKFSANTMIDSLHHEDPARNDRLLPDGRRVIWHDFTEEYLGSDPFIVHANDYVLASSREYLELPFSVGARFQPRSDLVRMGLMVFPAMSWACWVDPGFKGDLRLGLKNLNKIAIKVYPGMPVGRLVFEKVEDQE